MKWKLCQLIFLLITVAPAGNLAFAIDEAQFPPLSFSEFEKLHPTPKTDGFQIDPAAHGFSTKVIYRGKSRGISKAKQKFLQALALYQPENKELFSLFKKEIEVQQQGVSIWVPVEKQLFSLMKKELTPDQTIVLFVRYFGAIDAEPFYLGIHFADDHIEAKSN